MLSLDQLTGHLKVNKGKKKTNSNIGGSECSKFVSLLESNPNYMSSRSTCFHTAFSLFLVHTPYFNCTYSAVLGHAAV